MIEHFCLFVGFEYLVKNSKVFVIYQHLSKIKNQILYHDISRLYCYSLSFTIKDTTLIQYNISLKTKAPSKAQTFYSELLKVHQ